MNSPAPTRPQPPVVRLALLTYVPMMAGAFFLRSPGVLVVHDWTRLGLGLLAAALAGGAVVAGSRLASRRTGWGRALHAVLRQALGGLSSRDVLWLSLLSACGEEVLFRGVIHPRLGLWLTAAIFAAFHFPFRRELISWTLFAFAMGLAQGVLTDAAASLWPAIVVHFVINFFNLHDLAEGPLATAPPSRDSGGREPGP